MSDDDLKPDIPKRTLMKRIQSTSDLLKKIEFSGNFVNNERSWLVRVWSSRISQICNFRCNTRKTQPRSGKFLVCLSKELPSWTQFQRCAFLLYLFMFRSKNTFSRIQGYQRFKLTPSNERLPFGINQCFWVLFKTGV